MPAQDLGIIHQIAVFIIDSIAVWLLFLVFFSNPGGKKNRIFALMTLSMLTWVNFAYFARISTLTETQSLFLWIAWIFTPPYFFGLYFVVIFFLEKEHTYKYLNRFVLSVGISSSLLVAHGNNVVGGFEIFDTGYTIIYGNMMIPFLLTIILIILATIYPLARFYSIPCYSSEEREHKKKMIILGTGMTIFYVANVIFNVSLPVIFKITKYYFFGDYSTIILLVTIAYLIIRHELFELRTISTTFLVSFIEILLLVDAIFFSSDDPLFIVVLKWTVVITYMGLAYKIISDINSEIERRKQLEFLTKEIEERNKELTIILELINSLTKTLNVEKLAQTVVHILPQKLCHNCVAAFFFQINAQHSYDFVTLTEGIQNTINQEELTFLREKKLSLEQGAFSIMNLDKKTIICSLHDIHNPHLQCILEKLQVTTVALVPIIIEEAIIALLILGCTDSQIQFEPRLQKILETFSVEIALAFGKANAYEKLLVANRNLEEAYEIIKKSDEAKSEFLSIASHQLRTPISIIRGHVSMILDGDYGETSQEIHEILGKTEKNINRLSDIVEDILSITHIEAGRLELNVEPVPLMKIIKDVVDEVIPKAKEKNLSLTLYPPDEPIPMLNLDKKKIMQIFVNLIDNGIYYTEKGGIEIKTYRKEESVEIAIKDTGIGIPKEHLSNLFEKFSRAENARKARPDGSGIGLFIVKNIVEKHGGQIYVESYVEKGTTFFVKLPIPKPVPQKIRNSA